MKYVGLRSNQDVLLPTFDTHERDLLVEDLKDADFELDEIALIVHPSKWEDAYKIAHDAKVCHKTHIFAAKVDGFCIRALDWFERGPDQGVG